MLLNPVTYYESEEVMQEAIDLNRELVNKQRSLRSYIIDFIRTLSFKVAPSPILANFLFSDSRTG